MLDFISKDVRAYMAKSNLEFTDFEKAALIYHAGFPVLKRLELLEKLAEETQDETLKDQISTWLTYEREDLEAFWNNAEGYVYAVEVGEGCDSRICGYFATADLAYAHGMMQECEFEIEKYLIVGFNGQEAKKEKGYFNPNLMNVQDIKECITELDWFDSEVTAKYDKDGTWLHFYSGEIERSDEEEIRMSYDLSLFQNAFIAVPNPFERGDIVRSTMNHAKHGVIEISQQEWKEYLERTKSWGRESLDFYESGITVEFLQENGHLMHSHVSPAFLEKYDPQEGDEDCAILADIKSVLLGECELSIFLHYLEEYQKSCKTD